MTDHDLEDRASRGGGGRCAWFALAALLAAVVMTGGCASNKRDMSAIRAYYAYEFWDARDRWREPAESPTDEEVVLAQARLGMAALADGDLVEAERALGRSFEWLSTAGLNADRTTAAVLLHEGVRIWKGEPFEQALVYAEVAALYAALGDWENVRAAAANGLFRLTDFGEDQTQETLAQRAASDEDYLETGYTAVDTNFALGFLLQATGSRLGGGTAADAQFDAAIAIDERLEPVASGLRGDFDTLLIVDWGKGPTKVAYGPDNALTRFAPQDRSRDAIRIQVQDGDAYAELAEFPAVCDVNAMAADHRWKNLEDVRRAKSFIGKGLMVGGFATAIGSSKGEHQAIGVGLLALGAMMRASSHGDTRYLETLPQLVYLAPLRLGATSTLRVRAGGSTTVLPDVQPGTPSAPRTIYLRMHGADSPMPPWLTANRTLYGNDHTGVLAGDLPWILGGRDVSAPSRAVLEAYQAGGHLTGYTANDLLDLYRAEGIVLGSGAGRDPSARDESYRHILEGGTGLFTPAPHSDGYRRLMNVPHAPYEPRSDLVRNAARDIGVGVTKGPS